MKSKAQLRILLTFLTLGPWSLACVTKQLKAIQLTMPTDLIGSAQAPKCTAVTKSWQVAKPPETGGTHDQGQIITLFFHQ